MRPDDTAHSPSKASAPVDAADLPEVIVCRGCGRMLPASSLYCPHCCGADGRRGATAGGAFLGGLFGVLAGGLIAAVWSSAVGPEQLNWSQMFAAVLPCIAIGVVVGIIRSRKG
ncbi:hypothetical protein [Accumulibacter sp.]|uniref:hypothetical protein n=1 Tax=Accumulibacter sp. TaxID=2053492 RepID=UPI0025EF9FA5|nr:hypothetical protein [Accumulibacter sp.]MCP5228696.1 hypothetical protein [Accumulibacter sp.]